MMSPTRARADQRGFTLTELLVAIAIVGLVMTGLLTLLMAGNESYLAGANQVEAQAAVRAGLERMTQEIREAGYNPWGLPPCTVGLVPPACMDAIVNQSATQFTIQNDWNGSGCIQGTVGCADAAVPVCVPYSWAACPNPGGPNNRGEQITYSIVGTTLCRMESPAGAPPTAPCPAPAGQPLVTSLAQASRGTNCAGATIVLPAFFQYCDGAGNAPGAPVPANLRTVIVNFQVGVQNTAPGIWRTGAIQVTMSDRIRLRNRIP